MGTPFNVAKSIPLKLILITTKVWATSPFDGLVAHFSFHHHKPNIVQSILANRPWKNFSFHCASHFCCLQFDA